MNVLCMYVYVCIYTNPNNNNNNGKQKQGSATADDDENAQEEVAAPSSLAKRDCWDNRDERASKQQAYLSRGADDFKTGSIYD